MKNKGFTLIELLSVIAIIAIIAVITITTVDSSIKSSKEKAYQTQISQIEDAAKKWVNDNIEELDVYNLNTICLSIEELQEAKLLEKGTIKNPKDKTPLTGQVQISYDLDKNQYTYKYMDTCDEITVKPAYETLVVDNEDNIKLSGTEEGLYETINNYVYRGADPDNYIKMDNQLWRIINIDKDSKELKVIKLADNQVSFSDTMIEDLNEEYATEGSVYSNIKKYIKENSKINIGTVNELGSFDVVSSIEKSKNDYKTISIPTVSDYMNSSTDIDCHKKGVCQNNNYLNTKKDFYLLNSSVDESKDWYVDSSGEIKLDTQTNKLYNVYPVVTLKLSTQITGGTGTQTDPYIAG